jgi:ParB/RepB/Spo0J family partition protein
VDKVAIEKIKIGNFQVWSRIPKETFEQLVADVKVNGVTYPIIVDEYFVIIDGHHRYLAAKEAGINSLAVIVKVNLTEEQKLEIAYKENSTRRTIGKQEKITRALELRKERRSLRQIAAWLGVGKSTVERWLRENEVGVPNGTVNRVKGSDGKEYPSRGQRINDQRERELEQEKNKLQYEINLLTHKLAEREKKIQILELEHKKKIQRLEQERDTYKLLSQRYSFSDNGLKVFAQMVGLNEDASATEISRAFRKARAKAHPDGVDSDWVSARYNVCFDAFKRMYA